MRTGYLKLAAMPLLFALPDAAWAAGSPNWVVSEVSGAVSVGASGRAHPVSRGGVLQSGDVVSTGTGARAVLTRGEEYVIVSPSSRLRLPEAAESGGMMQWIEDLGTAVFRINKQPNPHFGVRTPYLAAVVKGTTFSVTVGETGASVQVVEGAVEVSTSDGGAAELIRPGIIASVSASNRFSLTVDGDTHHVIKSPNAPAESTPAAPASTVVSEASPAATVVVAVADSAPSLDALTDGLVHTDTGADRAVAVAVQTQGKVVPVVVASATGGTKPILTPRDATPIVVVPTPVDPTPASTTSPVTLPTLATDPTPPAAATLPVSLPASTTGVVLPSIPAVVVDPVVSTPAVTSTPATTVVAAVTAPVTAAITTPVTAPVTTVVNTVIASLPAATPGSANSGSSGNSNGSSGHGNGNGNNGNGTGNGGSSNVSNLLNNLITQINNARANLGNDNSNNGKGKSKGH